MSSARAPIPKGREATATAMRSLWWRSKGMSFLSLWVLRTGAVGQGQRNARTQKDCGHAHRVEIPALGSGHVVSGKVCRNKEMNAEITKSLQETDDKRPSGSDEHSDGMTLAVN